MRDESPEERLERAHVRKVEPKRKGNGADQDGTPRFPLVKFDDVLLSTASFYLVKDLVPAFRSRRRLWSAKVRKELLGL